MCSSSHFKLHPVFTMLLIFVVNFTLFSSLTGSAYAASVFLKSSIESGIAPNCGTWSVISSPDATNDDILNAVIAISTNNAWTVGDSQNGNLEQTLIEQWNGSSWVLVSSPNPEGAATSALNGITAISVQNVWAVGYFSSDNPITNNSPVQTLIEQWNGTSWSIIPSPNPSIRASLSGIARVPGTNQLWAVGEYQNNSNVNQTLIEHWDGTSWSVVSSPSPGSQNNFLNGVTAISANNVWVVGSYSNISNPSQTLIEHWNGTSWSTVSSPNPGSYSNLLFAATQIPDSNRLWAVGTYSNINSPWQTLIERRKGTSWSVVSSPSPGEGNTLTGVTAITAKDIWTVGYYYNVFSNQEQTLIEQWNGSSWSIVPSPNPGIYNNYLNGIARVPRTNQVWAVGYYMGNFTQTLIEYYC